MKITLFPIKTKKGVNALMGKVGDVTYFCSDDRLVSGDEVVVEPSDSDPNFCFLKRVASGITVTIPD